MVSIHLLLLLHVTSIGQLLSSLVSSFGRQSYMWPDQFSLFRYIQSFVVLLVSQVFSFSICDRAFHRICLKVSAFKRIKTYSVTLLKVIRFRCTIKGIPQHRLQDFFLTIL